MRRVLFIAYLFPPIANSGTRRSLSFANHLPDLGWDPLVLTCDAARSTALDPHLLEEVRPSTRIARAPLACQTRAERIGRWVPPRWRQNVIKGLAWRFQARCSVPDDVASWLEPAVKEGVKLFESDGFDVIYASGWPWTAFLVAKAISVRTGRPYVLDYRDQWTPSGDHLWEYQSESQAKRNPALQRLAAQDAAALITVTGTLVDSIAKDCGRSRIHLITNGFEPSDFQQVPPAVADGLMRITYTGVWRQGYGLQDLYAAVAMLKSRRSPELQHLSIEVAGFKPGPARDAGIDDIVIELGPVPHAEAVALMLSADLLYLPVPEGFYAKAALPGKLFEYLGCGRPILAVVPKQSEVADVLGYVGGCYCVEPGDVERIADLLLKLLRSELRTTLVQVDKIQRYTRRATTERLAKVLAAAADGLQLEPMR